MIRLTLVLFGIYATSSVHAEQIYYQDIPAGQSPFKSAPASPSPESAQQQADLYNSGLYKDAPQVYVPKADQPLDTSGSTGLNSPGDSKTFYDSAGIEYDVETGITTGRIDESKATSPHSSSSASDSGATASGGAGPASAGENTPRGYTQAVTSATTAVQGIRSLMTTAPGQNAIFLVPGMAQMESGEKAYSAGHTACVEGQASASTWCREETSPKLQTTLIMINAAAAAINTVAVKDVCSTTSKIMSMAQLGITAYTLSCGAMKKKCDISCGKVAKGLATLKSGLAMGATCTPANPMLPSGCPLLLSQFKAQASQLEAVLQKEATTADNLAIAGKVRLCGAAYTQLLASAGLSILSLAKSYQEAKNCEDNTDGSGGQTVAAQPSGTVGGSASANTPETSTSPPSSGETAPPEEIVRSEKPANPVSFQRRITEVDAEKVETSPYAAYLPGREKDPHRGIAGESAWRKEVTGAGGRSNWSKLKERYQDFDALP